MALDRGYAGRILDVDLTSGASRALPLEAGLARRFLGGRGLAAHLLFEHLAPRADPLGPDNVLILASGPLNGTLVPGSNRIVVTAKSPLTEGYAASVAGRDFAAILKYAGCDALILRGRAAAPCYLVVRDGAVAVRPAGHLWGMLTGDTIHRLRADLGDPGASVACVGPAGEHLVRYAAVIVDGHAAGRCGLGAVMGAKNLKAVVASGRGAVRVADPPAFLAHCREMYPQVMQNPATRNFSESGTAGTVAKAQLFGILPTRNFRQGTFEHVREIEGDTFIDHFKVKDQACLGCPVACVKVAQVRRGEYEGSWSEGPEYETLYALGSTCGNGDLPSIIHLDHLCDQLGLDTMSMGGSLAFAMECAERGLLSRTDLDGLDLAFGNHRAMREAIRKTAAREGVGDLLAEGSRRMAARIGRGSEAFAMHVKGLELGGYDPRGLQGEGLSMATSERGGCHHFGGYMVFAETSGQVDNRVTSGKAALNRQIRIRTIVNDSITHCSFLARSPALGVGALARALTLATGLDFTPQDLEAVGLRVMTLERCLNAREGLTRADDTLPRRLLEEPLPDGPNQGQVNRLHEMLDEFYAVCGWDPATGIPTPATLESLGLPAAAAAPAAPRG